jgi:hypothetical protein
MFRVQKRVQSALLVGLALGTWACEPAGVTEAREQLGRGGERTFVLTIPVAAETLTVDSLLSDLDVDVDTLAGGLLGISIEPETISVAVGENLRFDNLGFDPFSFSFDQMLRTEEVSTSVAVSVSAPAPGPSAAALQQAGDIEFTTPDGSQITSATVDTGTVVRTLSNSSSCDAFVKMALVDEDGDTLVFFDSTEVQSGGSVTDSTRTDGIQVDGFVNVELDAGPVGLCVPASGDAVSGDVTFLPMTLASVGLQNVNEDFTETYDALASETRIQAIDTIVVDSGGYDITAQNRLPIAISVDLTLNGIERPLGTPLTGTLNLPAAPGDGSTTTATLNFDFAGVTIIPSQVVISVTGTATADTATITPTVANDAVAVDGTGTLQIGALRGSLDPTKTPELNIAIEEATELPLANLELGDFEDVVRDATLNTVQIALIVDNQADVPVVLSNFELGAVRIDTLTGEPLRDPNTNELVFEADSATGQPLLVDTTLILNRADTTLVLLENDETVALINRVIDLMLDSVRVALVGSGTVVVGDGTQAGITSADTMSLALGLSVGVDFTIPASGVTFETNTVQDGLNSDSTFGQDDLDDLVSRIDSASITLAVLNGTPFQVEAVIAIVGDSLADTVDVFAEPGRILLDTVVVQAPDVDSAGLVIQPATSTATVSLTGEEIGVLLGAKFTAGLKVILKPPSGGRGAVRGSDQVIVEASARVQIRTGGGGQ